MQFYERAVQRTKTNIADRVERIKREKTMVAAEKKVDGGEDFAKLGEDEGKKKAEELTKSFMRQKTLANEEVQKSKVENEAGNEAENEAGNGAGNDAGNELEKRDDLNKSGAKASLEVEKPDKSSKSPRSPRSQKSKDQQKLKKLKRRAKEERKKREERGENRSSEESSHSN